MNKAYLILSKTIVNWSSCSVSFSSSFSSLIAKSLWLARISRSWTNARTTLILASIARGPWAIKNTGCHNGTMLGQGHGRVPCAAPAWSAKLAPPIFHFLLWQLEHKIFWKPLDISAYSSFELFCCNTVELSQVSIQHNPSKPKDAIRFNDIHFFDVQHERQAPGVSVLQYAPVL